MLAPFVAIGMMAACFEVEAYEIVTCFDFEATPLERVTLVTCFEFATCRMEG